MFSVSFERVLSGKLGQMSPKALDQADFESALVVTVVEVFNLLSIGTSHECYSN